MELLWILFLLLFVVSAFVLAYKMLQRGLAKQRLDQQSGETFYATTGEVEEFESSFLHYWLFKAGFRKRNAPIVFLGFTILFVVVGLTVSWLVVQSGILKIGTSWLNEMPGKYGDLFKPVFWVAPAIICLLFANIPLVYVRAKRRERVASMERDLPVILELLATLGEAGLAFDGSVTRILESEKTDRPLLKELQIYRSENLSGIPKVRCLRRLERRVDVGALTNVISSLVQAEQVGSSTAEVLRRQANDLRVVRRERAMVLAQALPVKLVFPLVICFLPGIFVGTLGPIFNEFIKTAETFIR